MSAYLVIGSGNELRGDDRAGRVVADRIEALDLEGVTVRSVTQLVPELALDLAAADRVLFVDADVTVSELVLRTLDGLRPDGINRPAGIDGPAGGPMTHHVTPEVLVGLAAVVGERAPAVVECLSIPGAGFELGSSLSPATAVAVDRAVTLIVERISTGEAGGPRPA